VRQTNNLFLLSSEVINRAKKDMTTIEIIRTDYAKLQQIDAAIKSLQSDKRSKSQKLIAQFMELRENIIISLESNITAYKLGCF
jgi:hypothetical protein